MSGKYHTIVCDPPWEIGAFPPSDTERASGRTAKHEVPYVTMSLDEIAKLPVDDLADPNAHVYLWTINRYLEQSFGVLRTWGFRPVKVLVWCKPSFGIGLGGAYASRTEYILFGRRGRLSTIGRVDTNWFEWRWGRHSVKPEAFLDMVEQVSPGPYLEMFARRNRLGWDTWGNECLEHVSI